ncbi:MAG: CDP-diacylglycerol--glycerol-3-phosphate 3-phosphatidyltransferase [Candidatus Saganbacteria bacterium]|nr:CDP-diacylglycerol--glycerol-3-phosphate 3-phosphatidyltransferase [Candidatus Saganbacteria bacterium]
MTLATKVTLARIALIPFCLGFLLTGFWGLSALLFAALSFSDAIDGYLARKYHQVSELGKQLDPLADKLLVLTMLIALTALGKAGPVPVMLLVAREFVIASLRTRKVFAASPVAKWKTVAEMVAVFLAVLNLPLAGATLWLAVILAYVSGGAYLWQSRLLKQLKLN